ncbi:hypothetical protein ASE73_02725 [Sphingomonas sp. Leaf24]|nr:hypothetical protein ASE50_02725 [Sphingomonas sp. Leaf5]KQM96014.1 hypothetical protein ASE73_02725 [Sphingomonas sp. Leaf24]
MTVRIASVINLPADDTVRAFEARDDVRATVRWHEMWQEDHARAFTVAKIARLDLLNSVRKSLATMLRDGGTFEQWRASIEPDLQKAGWIGKVSDPALTGADHDIYVGTRRLRTIYDTNLRSSRAAGRWQRIQALKASRPFLMYVAIGDGHTRPLHRRWGGLDPAFPRRIILPVDHPAWSIYYPPNDWGCRCTVRQLSQRDLDRLGLRVTTDDELRAIGWLNAAGEPRGGRQMVYRAAGRADPQVVPEGIGPGWAFNPGRASIAPVADKLRRSLEEAAFDDLAVAQTILDDIVQSPVFLDALNEPRVDMPVMVIAPDLKAAMGATNSVVTFSSDSFQKQRGQTGRSSGHPELTVDDYRNVPALGSPDHVFADPKPGRFNVFRFVDGRWRMATVKVLPERNEMFLLSFRYARPRELNSRLRNETDLLNG